MAAGPYMNKRVVLLALGFFGCQVLQELAMEGLFANFDGLPDSAGISLAATFSQFLGCILVPLVVGSSARCAGGRAGQRLARRCAGTAVQTDVCARSAHAVEWCAVDSRPPTVERTARPGCWSTAPKACSGSSARTGGRAARPPHRSRCRCGLLPPAGRTHSCRR